MSSYATVADISAEYKNVDFSASGSAVKATQVQNFLDQATAEINGKVGMRYVLPIVAPDALTLLKSICISIVVFRLRPLLKIDTGGTKGNQSPGSDSGRKFADQALMDIQSNKTDLTVFGAVLKSVGDGVDSYGARNKGGPGDGNGGQGATFKKGTRQW